MPATVKTFCQRQSVYRRSQGGFGERREHHFYLSGVIRPVDIQADNNVISSVIADADPVHGTWSHQRQTNRGWLNRSLDYVSPFWRCKMKYVSFPGVALLFTCLCAVEVQAARMDVAHFEGVRANQLIGYGLVVGWMEPAITNRLNSPFNPVSAMLSRMGSESIPINPSAQRSSGHGDSDASCSPSEPVWMYWYPRWGMREALWEEPGFVPADGSRRSTYAMAQGPIGSAVGAMGKSGSRVQKNHLNAGRVPNRALSDRLQPR